MANTFNFVPSKSIVLVFLLNQKIIITWSINMITVLGKIRVSQLYLLQLDFLNFLKKIKNSNCENPFRGAIGKILFENQLLPNNIFKKKRSFFTNFLYTTDLIAYYWSLEFFLFHHCYNCQTFFYSTIVAEPFLLLLQIISNECYWSINHVLFTNYCGYPHTL